METRKIEKLEVKRRYEINLEDDKQFVIINNVLINSDIIESLIYLQKDGNEEYFCNEGYTECASYIGEIFAYLAYAEGYTNDGKKVLELMQNLHQILQILREFKFPKELLPEANLI